MSLRVLFPALLLASLLASPALAQSQGPNQPPPDEGPSFPINGCGDRVCSTDQIQTPLQEPVEPPPGVFVPPDLTVPPPPADAEAERDAGGLPITGSGNGDLWTPPEEPKQ